MDAASYKPCKMSHIDHEVGTYFVGYGAHAGEVELARICAAATYDDFWFFSDGEGFEFVIVNGFSVFADLVADDAVELSGEVEFVAVRKVSAMSEIEAKDAFSWRHQGHVGGGVGL